MSDNVKKIAKLLTEDPDIFNEGWEELGIEDPFGPTDPPSGECSGVQGLITKVWDHIEKNPDWDPEHYFENNPAWLKAQEHTESCPTCNKFQEDFYARQDEQMQGEMDDFLGQIQSSLDSSPETSWKGLDAKQYLLDALRGEGDFDEGDGWKTSPLDCDQVRSFLNDYDLPEGVEDDEIEDYMDNVDLHISKCDNCRVLKSKIEQKTDQTRRMPWVDALKAPSSEEIRGHLPESILQSIAQSALEGKKYGGLMDSESGMQSLMHITRCPTCAKRIQDLYDQF